MKWAATVHQAGVRQRKGLSGHASKSHRLRKDGGITNKNIVLTSDNNFSYDQAKCAGMIMTRVDSAVGCHCTSGRGKPKKGFIWSGQSILFIDYVRGSPISE